MHISFCTTRQIIACGLVKDGKVNSSFFCLRETDYKRENEDREENSIAFENRRQKWFIYCSLSDYNI
jgi:hypothetical protein